MLHCDTCVVVDACRKLDVRGAGSQAGALSEQSQVILQLLEPSMAV